MPGTVSLPPAPLNKYFQGRGLSTICRSSSVCPSPCCVGRCRKLCVFLLPSHILLAFRGRQPLCGIGVLSVMEMTSKPPIVKPLMAAWKNKTAEDVPLSTHSTAEKGKSSVKNSLVPPPKVTLFQWFYFATKYFVSEEPV